MRVRLIFNNKIKGGVVPFHHQYHLYRLFNGLIKKAGLHGNNSVRYNYSGLKGQTTVSKAGLHFYSSKITIVFSCSNQSFLDKVLETLFDIPELKIGDLVLIPHSVEQEPDFAFEQETKYICISPIVLLQPEFSDESAKRFIHPTSEEFSQLLSNAIEGRIEESINFMFHFSPDKDYISKIENNGKKYSRVYPMFDADIPYEVRGYTFPFTLTAPPEVHAHLYESGLGLYNNKGFGMLDLATVKPGSHTTTYLSAQTAS